MYQLSMIVLSREKGIGSALDRLNDRDIRECDATERELVGLHMTLKAASTPSFSELI